MKKIAIRSNEDNVYIDVDDIHDMIFSYNSNAGYRILINTKENDLYIEDCNDNPFVLVTKLKEHIYTLNKICAQCKRCDARTRDNYEICNECCKKRFE